jgi:hypothetical protein
MSGNPIVIVVPARYNPNPRQPGRGPPVNWRDALKTQTLPQKKPAAPKKPTVIVVGGSK